MKIRYSPRAIRNLNEIFDYIHDQNPQAAIRVRQSIHDTIGVLASFPALGKSSSRSARKIVSPKYGYRIYYSISANFDVINIITIRHRARAGR